MFGNIEVPFSRSKLTGLEMNKEFPSCYGLIPRVFCDIINRIGKDPGLAGDTRVTMSFIEIHNEKIRDLLDLEMTKDSFDMKVRDHPSSGAYIEDLTKIEVVTCEEVLSALATGLSRRAVGTSSKNKLSSRYCVFTP